MPFPRKSSKSWDDEGFECFAEMIRPVFLRTRLTDILKMAPYAKYMKDIITNKRKIPGAEISTMLANYSFKDGVPKKLGDPGNQLYIAPLKETMSKLLCVTWEPMLVLCLSLYIKDLI